LPHFEKVTQIKTDYPTAAPIGGQNGVNHAEKSRYQAGPFLLPESRTKRKVGHPGRIHQHYRIQKPEVRPAPTQQAGAGARIPLRERHGGQTQTRQTKARQPERQKIYTGGVIASPRLAWAFFWYKCGKLPAPLIHRQMDYIALWPSSWTSMPASPPPYEVPQR
jgi:hypothetical protein